MSWRASVAAWLLKPYAQQSAPTAPERKSLPTMTIGVEQFFNIDNNGLGGTDIHVRARTAYKMYSLAFACMRFRATKLVEAPLWVYREGAEQEELPMADHELSEFLEQPNPDMTMEEVLELVSMYEDTTGAALLVKNRDRSGRIRSVYPFAKDEFTVQTDKGRLFGRFDVNTSTGTKTYGPDDVIYFRMPSTDGAMFNTSPVDAALTSINLGYSMFMALRSHLRNAIRPGAFFETDAELDDDLYNRLKQQAQEDYAGIWNNGKTMLLEGGVKAKLVQTSFRELELGPVNGDIEAAVCQCFGMHPALAGARIGLENSSGFADMIASARELYYDITQLPRWVRYEKKLTSGLLDRPGEVIRFDKSRVRSLQLDMTERTAQAKSMTGIWTIDEQRAWTNRPPLPNGEGKQRAQPAAPGADSEKPDKEKPPAKILPFTITTSTGADA